MRIKISYNYYYCIIEAELLYTLYMNNQKKKKKKLQRSKFENGNIMRGPTICTPSITA